jgi:hypothetical protein
VHRPCRAVLDRLFLIATWPVRQSLDMEPVNWSDKLVQYSCRLLARVVAELASQVCSIEVNIIPIFYFTSSSFETLYNCNVLCRNWMLVRPVEFSLLHRVSLVLVRTGPGILVMGHQTPFALL